MGVEKVSFSLDYPVTPAGKRDWNRRYSLNAYWSGKNIHERRRDAETWHQMVRAAMYRQDIPKRFFKRPVRVTFLWDDNLDIDNHAAMGKMVVDALKGWVLENDGPRWLREVKHLYCKGAGEIRVVVEEI